MGISFYKLTHVQREYAPQIIIEHDDRYTTFPYILSLDKSDAYLSILSNRFINQDVLLERRNYKSNELLREPCLAFIESDWQGQYYYEDKLDAYLNSNPGIIVYPEQLDVFKKCFPSDAAIIDWTLESNQIIYMSM